jgi:hypothetical protein
MPHAPIIHVMSYAQLATSECPTLMPLYHIDRDDNPLAMSPTLADLPWKDKLSGYETMLRQRLADPEELRLKISIDNIYNSSINGGVIIATLAQVVPFYTHAHVLRDIILELADA